MATDEHAALSGGFLVELSELLPADRRTSNLASLERLSRDQTETIEPGTPLAAAFPTSTREVSLLLDLATRHGVPVVPRGAGSGLAGGATAVDGCLILGLERMDRILEIDTDDLVAVVEPGVLTAELARAAAAEGVAYAPDPSSFEISTIGGNLATNAGGLQCLKYGVTRDAVLGLEVVLADGTVMEVGRRSVKGVVGYDLVGLFVGSEGTLGVITRATLRLRPRPPEAATLLASFGTLASLGSAVSHVRTAGVNPAAMEVMDQVTVAAVESWQHIGLDVNAAGTLLVRSDAPDAAAELEKIQAACRSAGADEVMVSTGRLEAEGLLAARRAALPALERTGAVLLEDIAVPLGQITAMLEEITAIASRRDVRIGTFGHLGDGNLHPTLVWPRGDAVAHERAQAAAEEILEATLALGGTVSGEHGVGLLKRDLLERELHPAALRTSRLIKAALDPAGILNPGKVLPPTGDRGHEDQSLASVAPDRT